MGSAKTVGLAVAAALALVLSACSGGSGTGSTTDGNDSGGSGNRGHAEVPYIAIVAKDASGAYSQAVKSAAGDEAKKQNATITFQGEPDAAAQIAGITDVLTQNPAALAVSPVDPASAGAVLQQAKTAGIPVIGFDSDLGSDVAVTTIGMDEKAAAAEAAMHLAGLLDGRGTVAIVLTNDSDATATARRDGFTGWMQQNAAGITLLDPVSTGGDAAKAVADLLSSHPQLTGIFAADVASADGVAKALRDAGGSGVTAVGFGAGKTQIQAVRDGVLAGAVTGDPAEVGRKIVDAAMTAIQGDQPSASIDTGFQWYDSSNLDDPKVKAFLYQ